MSIKRGDVGGTGDGTLNTIDQIVAQVAAEIRLRTAEAKIDANRAEAAAVDALEYRDQTEQLKNQTADSATMADQAATSALDSAVQAGISRSEAEMKAIEAADSAVDAENFALQAADEANLALQYKNDAAQSADRAELEADRAEAAADNVEMGTIPLFFVAWCPDRNHIWPGYVAADGQQLSSATYPDAAAGIAAGTVPTTDDATWLADPAQRGKYVADDGSGSFRIPDYNGKQAGSLGAVFLRGDGERSAGVAGEIQREAVGDVEVPINTSAYNSAFAPIYLSSKTRLAAALSTDGTGWNGTSMTTIDPVVDRTNTVNMGGAETRPLNVTGCWVIKLFGAVVEVGSADAEQLASDYANLAGRVATLESRPSLGWDQTWQDVTAQRAENTVYTNTTGRAIFVSIIRIHADTDREVGASITVDGKLVSYIQLDNEGARARSTTQAIVPPGAEYSATFFGTGTITTTWWELR